MFTRVDTQEWKLLDSRDFRKFHKWHQWDRFGVEQYLRARLGSDTTCWISGRQGKGAANQHQSTGTGTRFQQAMYSSSSSAAARAAGTADKACRHHRKHSSAKLQMQNLSVAITQQASKQMWCLAGKKHPLCWTHWQIGCAKILVQWQLCQNQ